MSRSIDFLIRTSWAMAVLAAAFALALLFDLRTIDGARAWLKPAKFAVSLSIYGFTFAWMLRHLTEWPRLVSLAAWLTTAAALVEMGLIGMQAGRGVPSHFNTSTPFDFAVYATMGLAITVQTVAAGVTALAMWRQPFSDRAMGRAIRLGLAITVIGSSTGGLMTRPSEAQLAHMDAAKEVRHMGSHSVGGDDGGPGLPGLRWSTEHGDIRVAHFFGLHAMQAIPLVALFTRRRMSDRSRCIVVAGAASSYTAFFLLLLSQALAGQPLTSPTGWIARALILWAMAMAGLIGYTRVAVRQVTAPSLPPKKETT
jgi:asparagine N-glycosylation enzyme membrane subunit Stt3